MMKFKGKKTSAIRGGRAAGIYRFNYACTALHTQALLFVKRGTERIVSVLCCTCDTKAADEAVEDPFFKEASDKGMSEK